MKILAVRLRNLNSLFGSWGIDLTAPEYASSGIFAITGPTGAGKSTILDAICLALFARTPRLGHISKGSNEIMSRRAGDCFAEVDFVTSHGFFRCHWAQHRARRSPEGELQPPRHELVDAGSNTVLETRSKEVGRLVEQVTGMDYDRFTRSILLAQGEFAAFLQAEADQRAPILEQITGTSIYSRISIAVHERTSEERKKTSLFRESLGVITLLTEEEERQIQASINECTAQTTAMQNHLGKVDASLHRLAQIDALQAQLKETEYQLQALQRRKDEARTDLVNFERGQRAMALLAEFSAYTQQQTRLATLTTTIETLLPMSEELRRKQLQSIGEHAVICRQVQDDTNLRQQEFETIKLVRALDLSLYEKRQLFNQLSGSRQQKDTERRHLLQTHQQLGHRLIETGGQLDQLATFLRESAADAVLLEQLAGFRQQIQQLETLEATLRQLGESHQEIQTQRVSIHEQLAALCLPEEQAKDNLATLQQQLQELAAENEKLLAGLTPSDWRHQAEQENLRLQQLARARELLTRQEALAAEQIRDEHALQLALADEQRHNQEIETLEQEHALLQQLVTQYERNHQLALRMRTLHDEREHLIDGQPCPLCGSLQHPWAMDLPPSDSSGAELNKVRTNLERSRTVLGQKREVLIALAKDCEYHRRTLASRREQQTELDQIIHPLMVHLALGNRDDQPSLLTAALIKSTENRDRMHQRYQAIEWLASERQRLYLQMQAAQSVHAELSLTIQKLRHADTSTSNELQRIDKQTEAENTQIEHIRTDLLRQVQPLGINQCLPGQAVALLAQLEGRLQTWKDKQRQYDQLNRQRQEIQTELDKQALRLTGIDNLVAQQTVELDELKQAQARLWSKRHALFGDRQPDEEEQRLNVLVQQSQSKEKLLQTQLHALDKQLHALNEQLQSAEQARAELRPRSQTAETVFLDKIHSAGFSSLEDYRQALLPQDQMSKLADLHQELNTTEKVLNSRREERLKSLTATLEAMHKQGEQTGREELQLEQERVRLALAEMQQRIGADQQRLASNLSRKRQHHEQRQLLAGQERELARWERLHLLIGSADGKKFRVFAQGLTFEVMISHANRQLRKMNDRYILLRDSREPLALQVIDNYQAGETRSTRNLSGGESFLVSLALSLGLSAMASHNVRVDSLFLDEGFGTLDEEALDTALQTLAELRQNGKLIGIISHVPILKDRIDIRIQVSPGVGGNSRLIGPGCSRLS